MNVILEEEGKGNGEEGHQEKRLYLDCISVMGVYTVSVCDTRTYTLYNIIKEKVTPDSIVYTDAYHSYNILDVSDFQHYRINHATEFTKDKNHNQWDRKFLESSQETSTKIQWNTERTF